MDKLEITISEPQKKLLQEITNDILDMDVTRAVSAVVRKGEKNYIYLDPSELEELVGNICFISNHEENSPKLVRQLDELAEYLENRIEDSDEEEEDYSKYSEDNGSVYILKVALDHSKRIWRKVAIRGGQTLHDLHNTMYRAFDREEEHLYSFYLPTIPAKSRTRKAILSATEYSHPYNLTDTFMYDEVPDNAATTSIESLRLFEKQKFYYLFDFGDEWWHEITVEQMYIEADNYQYPRIVNRSGDSPEQYPDPDQQR